MVDYSYSFSELHGSFKLPRVPFVYWLGNVCKLNKSGVENFLNEMLPKLVVLHVFHFRYDHFILKSLSSSDRGYGERYFLLLSIRLTQLFIF